MKLPYTLLIIFMAAMIGSAINQLLLLFIPPHWTIYGIFEASINPEWSIKQLDLIVMNIGFRMRFHFSVLTLLGIVAGCILSLRRT